MSVIESPSTIVLHAVSGDDAFLFWGEAVETAEPILATLRRVVHDEADVDREDEFDAEQDPTPESDSSPSSTDDDSPRTAVAEVVAAAPSTSSTLAHPFAATHAALRTILDRDGVSIEEVATDATITLVLPHHAASPAPSLALGSRLGLDTPDAEDLRPQTVSVPAISLPAAAAVDLLTGLVDRSIDGLITGHDVRFWSELAMFATELIADQRFVPTVTQVEGGPMRGRWVPWLADGELSEPLRHLAGAMPPVAAATADLAAPDRWTVIESALEAMVDGLVRRTLIAEDFADAIDGRDPLADRQVAWLGGLLGATNEIRTSPEVALEVMRGARHWLGGLIDPAEGRSVRLCLQLAEPLEGVLDATPEEIASAVWDLGFHLIVTDDPPTIVDAAQIWADGGGGRLASVLGAEETPGDLLLAELARAQRIWPRLQDALEEIDPTGVELSTGEAHAFLQDIRPILQEAGIEVLVPSWWGQATSRIGVRMMIDPHGDADTPPGVGLSSLVDYAWEISIGDESVGLEELRRLADQGVPLVRIGDRWVEIRREDFDKASAFLSKHPGGAATLGEVLRLAAGGDDVDAPAISGIRTSGWIRELLGDEGSAPEDSVRPITVPAAFKGSLRPYQERGLAWLSFLDRFGLGGCLADDMGLGKTIQMIALLQHERESRPKGMVRPTLLVCPMSVAGNWRRELERFAPELRVHVQHGPDRPVGERFAEVAADSDVVVTTYALVSRDHPWIEPVEWERVVLDEAQHVKNPPTKQATAIRALQSRHRVALTGTPVENR
ncbi:MAG: helicase HelZ, partial [Planctomycetota bacterium]